MFVVFVVVNRHNFSQILGSWVYLDDMSVFRRKWLTVRSDMFLRVLFLVDLLLAVLHGYQYVNSGFMVQPLVRLVLCLVFPVPAFFAGRQGVYWFFWLYSCVLAIQTDFQNYTAFVLVVIFCRLVPRVGICPLAVYVLEVFTIATIRHKSPVHLLIHFLNCAGFYFAINFLLAPVRPGALDLTNDDLLILDELLQGKSQKEVTLFSQNTVTDKLKKARIRNGCRTTDELLVKYRRSKE